jgi:DNA-binding IclR family transcriptional regulator
VALNQSQVAERAGVNQSTVSRNIGVFEELGVVEVSDGRPTEYRINRESSIVQGLQQAQMNLLEHTDRLLDDDVEQLEDRPEWQPMEDTQREEQDAFASPYRGNHRELGCGSEPSVATEV